MVEQLGRRFRGVRREVRRVTFAEWISLILSLSILAFVIFAGTIELRRQGLAREALAQCKAARLAATIISSEQYAHGAPYADFTTEDGLTEGVQERIRTLGRLPGTVQLLQTDASGYKILKMAYLEDDFFAIYDADGSWEIWRGEHRIKMTFDPTK